MSLHFNNALKAYNGDIPEWVKVLAQDCDDNGSLAVVSRKIGASTSWIQQAINNKYTSPTSTIKEKVEGYYLGRVVMCPVLDSLPSNECQEHQKRPFSATNPQRVRIFKACRNGCKHSKLEG